MNDFKKKTDDLLKVTQTTKSLFCSLELLFFVDILNFLLFNEVLQEFNFKIDREILNFFGNIRNEGLKN